MVTTANAVGSGATTANAGTNAVGSQAATTIGTGLGFSGLVGSAFVAPAGSAFAPNVLMVESATTAFASTQGDMGGSRDGCSGARLVQDSIGSQN